MSFPAGKIRYSSFESQANIVGCATPYGFAIYDLASGQPMTVCILNSKKEFEKGTVNISTLGMSNIVAIVPMQENPTKVFIWDRYTSTELASFNYDLPVTGIKLRPDYILCSTSKQLQVRALSDSSLITRYDTAFNRDGVFDICSSYTSSIVAFPSPDIGVVTIVDCLDPTYVPKHVHAFKSPINFIKFNENGRLIAVCGDESKTIIVYSLPSLNKLVALKRGGSSSKIHSISFDLHATQLSITGDGGSLHVFDLHQDSEDGFLKPAYKLKENDSSPVWVSYSSRTLRLIGISSNASSFKVGFNQNEKSAVFETIETKLKLK